MEAASRSAADIGVPDRFSLERRLARGAMADVWLALDRERGEYVALKCARSPVERVALAAEARVLSALDHPAIVGLIERADRYEIHRNPGARPPDAIATGTADAPGDRGTANAAPSWLALEYLPGGTLLAAAARPLPELLDMLLSLADALAALHAAGFAHLDLKPTNVLLDASQRPRLIDFGVARPLGESGPPGSWLGGSPKSASPQRVTGEPVRIADDVYGFGALAYELLGGTPPLGSAPAPDDVRSRLPESLAALAPELPSGLAEAVDAMLAKDPAARPRDFAAVRARLAPFAAASLAASPTERGSNLGHAASGRGVATTDRDLHSRSEPYERTTIPAAAFSPARAPASSPRPSSSPDSSPRRDLSRGDPVGTPVRVQTFAPLAPAGAHDTRGMRLRGPRLSSSATLATASVSAIFVALVTLFFWWSSGASPAATSDAAGPTNARVSAPTAAPPASTAAPRLSPEERARRQEEARTALGQWASLRTRFEGRGAAEWGAREWTQAEEAAAEGDTFFQARDYAGATERYAYARARLIELEQREPEILSDALRAGGQAITSGDRDEALRQFDLALRIEPGSDAARRGRDRALALEETLARVRAGLEAERQGKLREARDRFAEALELDSENTTAGEALARIDARLGRENFDRLVAQGFEALESERFEAARKSFEAARALRSDSPAVREGLSQLESRSELAAIQRLRSQAEAAEREERYAEAVAAYASALEIDSGLSFAVDGRARSERLRDLQQQLESAIQAPGRLLTREVRDEARGWVAQAEALSPRPAGIERSAARLTQLIALASQPVPVVFESDNQTRVVLLRVGALGTFERRETELEPGRYTVVGIREGYRDARESFLVTPGKPVRIQIRAEEAI